MATNLPCPLLLLLLSTTPSLVTSSSPALPSTLLFTILTTCTILPPAGADDLPACTLPNGTLIHATEDDAVLIIDDVYDDENDQKNRQIQFYACLECFCLGDFYYDDEEDFNEDDEGDGDEVVSEALCLAIDCATPRCVDPVRQKGQCCPICPRGENCYITTKSKNAKEKTCYQTPKKMRKKNNKKNKNKRRKRGKRDKKRKNNEKTDMATVQREIIPAGKTVQRGNRKCRCNETEPEFATPYNTEAVCQETVTVSEFLH